MRRRAAWGTKLPYKNGYPGDGYHYIQCDICGKKMRAKDAQIISDKFSDKANLLVCGDDFDKTNPQQYIRAFKERQISHPRYIRSEGADSFQVNANDDRAPSAPRYLQVIGATASGIELQWIGPEDVGSSGIIGYRITRSTPCGATHTTLVTNTNSISTYYVDTTANTTLDYGYKVAAINSFGVGPFSEEACFEPAYVVPTESFLVAVSGETLVAVSATTTELTTEA